MQIYLAGPLFTAAERAWMCELRDEIGKHAHNAGWSIVWPGDLFTDGQIATWGADAKHGIFKGCLDALDASAVVVAVLDGTQVDDGTAWEIGYAYAKRKPVIGLRTDFRNGGDTGTSCVNCMIEACCEPIYRNTQEILERLESFWTRS